MKVKSILIAVLISVIISSCQEEKDVLRSDSEIINLLKIDAEFQTIFKEASTAQSIISNKVMQLKSEDRLNLIKNSMDISDITEQLNLSPDFIENLDEKFYSSIGSISNRYPELKDKTEDELKYIIGESMVIDISYDLILHNFKQFRVMDECDDQFEEEFDRIHTSHDRGVAACVVVALATAGAGWAPCSAVNIVKTSLEMAEAMDAHSACKQN